MFVSTEPEARKPWKGWKAKLEMLALCPVSIRTTGKDRKQQSDKLTW